MRLWSLHPRYLDRAGLVALWREALLAQAVLAGRTRGYTRHPQLARFRGRSGRARRAALGRIAAYLRVIHVEAEARGYGFRGGRIARARRPDTTIPVSRGQLDYEWRHLGGKLAARDPRWLARLERLRRPRPHPLFRVVPGGIEPWERPGARRRAPSWRTRGTAGRPSARRRKEVACLVNPGCSPASSW